jgi:hypothetical protein
MINMKTIVIEKKKEEKIQKEEKLQISELDSIMEHFAASMKIFGIILEKFIEEYPNSKIALDFPQDPETSEFTRNNQPTLNLHVRKNSNIQHIRKNSNIQPLESAQMKQLAGETGETHGWTFSEIPPELTCVRISHRGRPLGARNKIKHLSRHNS